jgi:hypothetical protein
MHLSEIPILIRRLFIDNNTKNKVYKLRLYLTGSWECIAIDPYVPCFPYNLPIYLYSKISPWVSLLEKTIAKYSGSYDNIRNISIFSLYKLLTGLPVIELIINDNDGEENIFNTLEDGCKNGYMLSAHSKSDNYLFISDIVYPILSVIRVDEFKLIVLRNLFKNISFESGEYFKDISTFPNALKDIYLKYQSDKVLFLCKFYLN